MDYFVSSEDTAYSLWQTEFLIQSFKLAGIDGSLVAGVAANNDPKMINFQRNLEPHKRRFKHDNIGRKRGLLSMNKPYAVYHALKNGVLTQPFVLLSPDMVLNQGVGVNPANITFQVNPGFTRQSCEKNDIPVSKHIEGLLADLPKADHNCWIPLGSVMYFNNVPLEFFSRVINWCETLEFDRCKTCLDKKEQPRQCFMSEKAAWVLALIEYWGTLNIEARNDLEMSLIDHHVASHFIHYQHGLPPYFAKSMFRYDPPDALALGDLYHTALSHNPTTSTNIFQRTVRSYVEEHKIDIKVPQYTLKTISVAVADSDKLEDNSESASHIPST